MVGNLFFPRMIQEGEKKIRAFYSIQNANSLI